MIGSTVMRYNISIIQVLGNRFLQAKAKENSTIKYPQRTGDLKVAERQPSVLQPQPESSVCDQPNQVSGRDVKSLLQQEQHLLHNASHALSGPSMWQLMHHQRLHSPHRLCQCSQPRQQHVLCSVIILHIFAPQVGLTAQNVCGLIFT
jgi:hypothetical protein